MALGSQSLGYQQALGWLCGGFVRVRLLGPDGIWVRWPGGKTVQAKVPAAAREISVNQFGELKVLR